MDLKEVRFSIKAKSVKVLRTLTDFDGTVLGGPTRTRTWDKPVMSRRLCQLSYRPNTVKYSKKQSPSRRRPVRPKVEACSARATVFSCCKVLSAHSSGPISDIVSRQGSFAGLQGFANAWHPGAECAHRGQPSQHGVTTPRRDNLHAPRAPVV